MRSIDCVKKKFVEEGFEPVLERRPSTRVYEKKIDGDVEAKLVQLCRSEPPPGYTTWSLRLLAYKMVELDYVPIISHVSVGGVLKKNELKPRQVKGWVIPPESNGEFVATSLAISVAQDVLRANIERAFRMSRTKHRGQTLEDLITENFEHVILEDISIHLNQKIFFTRLRHFLKREFYT